MKRGCTATMLKQKCSRRSGWENPRHNQKKHVSVAQMWRWCWLFFLIGRVLFIMSLFHVVRQSINSFTWRSWSVWGKQCEGRGLRRGQKDLDAAPWQCTSPRVASYPWIFGEARDDCRASEPLLSRFGPCGLFPVPKVEVHPKRSAISDSRGHKRKFATGPSRHPAKHVPERVPELEKMLGAVYQQ